MANTEYVDKLVAEGFFDDVERLKKELPLLAASMEQLSKAGRDVNAALGSTRTLKDVVENTDKATKVNETASRTVKVLTEDTLKLNMAIKAQNDALKLNVQIAQAQDGSIAKEILLVKQLTAERNRLNLETQKGRAEELKAQIDAKNDWIKSNSDKLSAQKINIGNYPEMMAQMAAIRNEMAQMEAAGLKGTQVFADMEGKLTEISRAMGPTSAQMAALTNSMTFLAQAGKQDTQEFKDLQQQAMALRVNMNYVKSAVSGTSDAMNKNASAMHSGRQASYALTQVMREMPAFAYSTSTGILAVSNNIPILLDRITELKAKNKELADSGEEVSSVWEQIKDDFFSVNTLVTLGIAAFTIISARITMAGDSAEDSSKKVDALVSSLVNLRNIIERRNASLSIAMDTEIIQSQRLIDVYKNQNTVAAGKINAYNELQAAYPKILSALTDEELRHKKISVAHEAEILRLNDYIKVKTQIAEKDKELNASIQLRDEALSTARRMFSIQRRRELGIEFRNAFGNQAFPDLSKIRNDNERVYFELLRTVRTEEARIARLKEEQVTSAVQLANIENVKQPKKEKRKEEENEFQVTLDRYVVLAQTREQYEAEQEAKFQARLAVTKDIEEALQDQRTGALNELNKQHEKGAISYETYSKSKEDMDKRFVYTSLILHKAYYEELLKEYPGDPRIQALISKANKDLADLYAADAANFQKEQQKKKKEIEATHKHMKDLVREAVQQSIDTNAAFVDGYYQKQIDAQQRLLDSINQRKDAEINAINNTMESDEKKHKRIQALNAQTAQQEKQIQAEMRRLKREQAIADRIASVLRAVENTAGGVTRALHDYKWPFSLIPAGIVAGIGAAQVAAIFAQPLPQYGDGTPKDKVGHPGGPAIIGDKPEWVMEPGKAPYFTSSTHIRNLPRFTRVIPEKDMVAGSMGFLTPQLMQSIYGGGNDMGGIEKKLEENAQMIASAIKNKPETTFIASNGEFKKIVKRGNSYITYLNDNFS